MRLRGLLRVRLARRLPGHPSVPHLMEGRCPDRTPQANGDSTRLFQPSAGRSYAEPNLMNSLGLFENGTLPSCVGAGPLAAGTRLSRATMHLR